MEYNKVIKVDEETIGFDNGLMLYSEHDQDCCESHYLSFGDLTIEDFDGLEFDLNGDNFFERVEGYGIALLPVNGHPVRVPGYGCNNGYYSTNLTLVLSDNKTFTKRFDITECQDIED